MLEDSIKRLKALIFARALVVTILLGSFYIFKIGYNKLFYPTGFSYFIISLYLLTIIYIIALRWIKNDLRFTVFAYIQIIIDVIAETTLIYMTGGIESLFSFMFPLSIVSASIVLNRRACYIIATLSSILYGALLDFQFYNIIPITSDVTFTGKDYFYNIFAHITAFYLIAFLSGYLSEKLHRATQSLEERDTVLSDLKAFSRDIIESMPSGVFTTDLNKKIITFNSSAQKITQLTLKDVIGKKPEDIFPFLSNIKEPLERIEGEIHRNGKVIPIGMRFSTLKDSSGKPMGTIGVFQDLTELKAMEAEMRKKEKWAFIGELSALIAHELRNPLASLKASVEMLREKKVSGEHADQLMKIALSEMDRLNDVVTDFLLYAKPQELDKKSFDLHQSLRDITTLLRSSEINNKNVKIFENLPGKLLITGDPGQLQQVFWNLGINAIEALDENGSINIYTKKKADTVEIVFKDNGIGINKEDIDKIFYPFFTTKERGTGLGLSIAQKIVEEHGGKITVESNGRGTGTTFTVVLPL
jgi:two-component system sensor histidine kinase PilS (NtrC family)